MTALFASVKSTDLLTVRLGIPLTVLLVVALTVTDLRRDRIRRPGRLLTAATLVLGVLFTALVTYRFAAISG